MFTRIKKSKTYLPNPNFEYRVVFKKGTIEAIKRIIGKIPLATINNRKVRGSKCQ